jgi:hypothetical protein
MGKIIMKEAPDVDFYVEWSSVVEAPTFAGTRAEMLAHIQRDSDPWLREDAPHHPEQRLRRVDETGTSSLWVTKASEESPSFAAHGYPEEGSWADNGQIYQQQGFCPRDRLFELTRRVMRGDDPTDLLEPFDDDAQEER